MCYWCVLIYLLLVNLENPENLYKTIRTGYITYVNDTHQKYICYNDLYGINKLIVLYDNIYNNNIWCVLYIIYVSGAYHHYINYKILL